ncbi:MAG: hydroxymethylglutaryl-CoA reductase [Actinomycetota bacterium]
MAQSLYHGRRLSDQVRTRLTEDAVKARLAPRTPDEVPLPPRLPAANLFTPEGLARRREFLKETYGFNLKALDGESPPAPVALRGNIENHIGFASMPLGLIGPLRINGLNARGDYLIPLATTEGALVASYHRGAHVLSLSGGVSACCLAESLSRAPGFVFQTLTEALGFMDWVVHHAEEFPPIIAESTDHGHLLDIKLSSCGTLVYLIFEYETGDAAGQNMVTLATDRICRHIVEHTPYPPQRWYVEANLSGDKKASMLSFQSARGKKVVASAIVPARLTRRFLHCEPEEIAEYCQISALGGIQSGTIGVQGHYANALAALFISCGQDAACVAEASVGITQMRVNEQNELEVSVTLPNLIVGTVGGGTGLPSAKACLEMMDCYGTGKARTFAEICAATVLAGELSIIAALASGEFASAHAKYRPAKPSSSAP